MTERYWPFETKPADQLTPLHRQQMRLLETAYAEGFAPRLFMSDSFEANAGERVALIIRRTRRWWELRVISPAEGDLSAYVSGYDVNAEAALMWLRGSGLEEVLEFVRPHLVAAGGRKSGFALKRCPIAEREA